MPDGFDFMLTSRGDHSSFSPSSSMSSAETSSSSPPPSICIVVPNWLWPTKLVSSPKISSSRMVRTPQPPLPSLKQFLSTSHTLLSTSSLIFPSLPLPMEKYPLFSPRCRRLRNNSISTLCSRSWANRSYFFFAVLA